MGSCISIDVSSLIELVYRCCNCLARQANYVRHLEENLDALQIECDELSRMRNDVKRRVDLAEGQQMKRLDQVEGWLEEVQNMESDVGELITDGSKETQQKCLGGCCPKNSKTSLELGKKVAKKLEEVAVLKGKGDFKEVAYKLPLPSGDERPNEPPVGLNSAFNEVWSYIEDEQVGIIGLYGMGGVGKTALLTEINNKLCNTPKRFDVLIWVVVSKNLDPIKVQDDIGKKIGFQDDTWNQKSQDRKAVDIYSVLKEKKFVLLLDDVWKRLELTEVGIPLPVEKNGSKIVFTTRSENVCASMVAHRRIKVECLAWTEAWDLFKKQVGEDTLKLHPEIIALAETVARECDGLPLALITIGRAMAYKRSPQEWNHASQLLQKSAARFSGMEEDVFARLKFSFDNLQSDNVKSCFLYCSLFPEDYMISKETLIKLWICEGFLDEFDDFNGAQNQGHDIIGTLIRACLLEECSADTVKMHDMIRDMALWIYSECGTVKDKVLVQARAGLKKAPEVGKWNGIERMSLMHNKIVELIEIPSCPNLLTLFLNYNCLEKITPGFFQNMNKLRVLDLSWNRYLDELPSEISKLVSLQYLNLSFTNIKEFPVVFKNLVDLKYLNLGSTIEYNMIPEGVLSSFTKLQVLKMHGCRSSDTSAKDDVLSGRLESFVKEMESLEDLSHLGITLKTDSALQRIINSPKLRSCIKNLSLDSFNGSEFLHMSFLEHMTGLHHLEFNECADLRDLIVQNSEIISYPSFHNLCHVSIYTCSNVKELTWLIFAPNLEELVVQDCHRMKEVIRGGRWGESTDGRPYLNVFAKLKTLNLFHLSNLKSIYPNALPFPCLESLTVNYCPNLNKLPLNSDSAQRCRAIIKGDEYWWNGLEWEDEATRIAFLRHFQILKSRT